MLILTNQIQFKSSSKPYIHIYMYMLKKKEKKLPGHILCQYQGHNIVISMQNFIFIGISSPKILKSYHKKYWFLGFQYSMVRLNIAICWNTHFPSSSKQNRASQRKSTHNNTSPLAFGDASCDSNLTCSRRNTLFNEQGQLCVLKSRTMSRSVWELRSRPPACDRSLKRTEREMASRDPSERNNVKPTLEKSDDMIWELTEDIQPTSQASETAKVTPFLVLFAIYCH